MNTPLIRLPALGLLLALALPALAQSQDVPSAPAVQTTPGTVSTDTSILTHGPQALAGFQASYAVSRNGSPLGTASMQVINVSGNQWRIDLGIHGTQGIAGIAGLNLEQSTVFLLDAGQFRPVTQSTVRNALFSSNKSLGIYDWTRDSATWSGDIKKTRRGPVALQPGDLSALLVNLAIVRDARPGATLQYRVVDNGRARMQQYAVGAQQQVMNIGEIGYQTLPVTRTTAGGDGMAVWVSEGVPTPIRITQTDNDIGTLDLQLLQYKVIQ